MQTSSRTYFALPPHLRHRVDLVTSLVSRDLQLRYKGSLLGVAWGLVTPLAQLLVFVLVFRGVVRLSVPHYATYVFSGLLSWNWFQTSLYGAATSLIEGRGLIRRPGFPAAVLPAVTVATNLIQYLLALPVLLLFMLLDGVHPSPCLLALPMLLALQFLLTLSLAYLVAISHVMFRDTQQILSILMMLLFYLTPVFYDAKAVPARFVWVYRLNPMVHLIDAYRAILLRGELPNLPAFALLTCAAAALFAFGYRAFGSASHRLAEEL